MASYGKYYLIFLFLALACIAVTNSIERLEPSKGCSDRCEEKYSSETALYRSCTRGCRFFILATFTSNLKNDETNHLPTQDKCLSSCSDAYSDGQLSLNSCNDGCNIQDEFEKEAKANADKISLEEEEEQPSFLSRLHSATPVLQVRKVMSDVIGRVQIITSQVLTYFVRDDKTLIAVQGEPEVIIRPLPEDVGEPEISDNSVDPESEPNVIRLNALERNEAFAAGSSPSETVTRVSLHSQRYTYLMHLLVLLAGVSICLLGVSYCLALARHQQRKTLKAANLNLALQQEPLKLVRPEDLTKLSLMEEEEQNAAPLPNKQELNLSHANV